MYHCYKTYRVLLILKSDGVFGSRSRKMSNEPLGGLAIFWDAHRRRCESVSRAHQGRQAVSLHSENGTAGLYRTAACSRRHSRGDSTHDGPPVFLEWLRETENSGKELAKENPQGFRQG